MRVLVTSRFNKPQTSHSAALHHTSFEKAQIQSYYLQLDRRMLSTHKQINTGHCHRLLSSYLPTGWYRYAADKSLHPYQFPVPWNMTPPNIFDHFYFREMGTSVFISDLKIIQQQCLESIQWNQALICWALLLMTKQTCQAPELCLGSWITSDCVSI